ncbi:RES family NAD+ phosphorylase [Paraburkholderia atlantica]|uniref:RES family NAD+ phosphorylase n=1 Tax=Paraburkholderia atlantica TaxID=2654982 RepID=UPI00160EAECE|nr:RES family NAD+ phosphorylase [Paraburkholderia atlantica]MBB5511141.1 RES domain-containing protein [Paraburkholderia atlantica]
MDVGGFDTEWHYGPFAGSEIGAPSPTIASAGRANRAGVSFLYCATNESTAVAEIRPHPGERVSIGAFRIVRDLRAYDLSRSQLLHYFESDKFLDAYVPFNTLSILINKTITPAERSQYSITQLIADCIRQLGFDAVLFESTVGSGTNAVLFNSGDAKLLPEEGKVFLINKVEYSFVPEQTINSREEYVEDYEKRLEDEDRK